MKTKFRNGLNISEGVCGHNDELKAEEWKIISNGVPRWRELLHIETEGKSHMERRKIGWEIQRNQNRRAFQEGGSR